MAKIRKRCRAINFDYDSHELRLIFGNDTTAYKLTKRFMEENCFKHRQYSGYISINPLSNKDVYELVEKMYQEMPWLVTCAKKIDITTVEDIYDAIEMYKSMQKADLHELLQSEIQFSEEEIIDRISEEMLYGTTGIHDLDMEM